MQPSRTAEERTDREGPLFSDAHVVRVVAKLNNLTLAHAL
jgi:hypothetical protein